MRLGCSHYVPVLKLKKAEKDALHAVRSQIRDAVVPLLEVVERKEDPETKVRPTVEQHLDRAFKGLEESVCHYRKYFLEPLEIETDGQDAIQETFRRAAGLAHKFTPVTGLDRKEGVAAALRHSSNGIAIRLTRKQLESRNIGERLNRFLVTHKLSRDAVDLILDLGATDEMILAGVIDCSKMCIAEIPAPDSWRSVILSGCDFPRSMAVVAADSKAQVDRVNWQAWKRLFQERSSARLPTFSDCAIQNRSGVEGFDPRTMSASAAIRYALEEQWLLIKGRSTRNASGQFSALAGILASNDRFAGHTHCVGCDRVRRIAEGEWANNSTTDWRQFGTIHHITRTVDDIRALTARGAAPARR